MRLRAHLKFLLYGSLPGFRGRFPYFGTQVYFPENSLAFRAACEQGIYEEENVRLLQALVRPHSWMFDAGANLGLMSIPVLRAVPEAYVVAFEPSPNALPWLRRTMEESSMGDRWRLVPKAVGADSRRVSFSVSGVEEGLYDGIRATGRAGENRTIEVEQTTLDLTWRDLGSPKVSMIKCDVEGGELDVLEGARECLAGSKPAVLTEINRQNIAAYGQTLGALMAFIREVNYQCFSVPHLVEVRTPRELEAHAAFGESFLLLPGD